MRVLPFLLTTIRDMVRAWRERRQPFHQHLERRGNHITHVHWTYPRKDRG